MLTSSLLLERLGMSSSLGLYGRSSLDFDMFQFSNSGFLISGSGLQVLKFSRLLGITTGSLLIKDNTDLSSLGIPMLHAVSGSFEISNSLMSRLSLPKLSTIGGNFSIVDNTEFTFEGTRISASSFPSMSYVGGNILLYNNGPMDVNSILSISVNLNGGTWANTLTITGSYVTPAMGVGKTYMDTLNTRGATLIVPVTGSDIISITESAVTLTGITYDNTVTMSGYSAPNLKTVTGNISFQNDTVLSTYSAPVLEGVSGNYTITTSSLTSISIASLINMSSSYINFGKNSVLTTVVTASTINTLGNVFVTSGSLSQDAVDNLVIMVSGANGGTWASTLDLRGGGNSAPDGPTQTIIVNLNLPAGPPFFGRGANVKTN